MIQKGLIKLDQDVFLPEGLYKWKDEEEFISEKKVGIWAYDTGMDEDD